ncbi:PPE domain-containing protein, partial [Mycobacterium kansasii]
AAFEGAYEEMWAQDVGVMAGYHAGASAAAAQLTSWQQSLSSALGLPQNIGVGNNGSGNVGNGNHGDANVGNGNAGNSNVGSGNTGSS